MAISGVNCGYIRCELWLYLVSFVGHKLHIKSQHVQHDQCQVGLYDPISTYCVFQWRHLQRLVVPQNRYGERSEPLLKTKRLSQQRRVSHAWCTYPPFSVASYRRFLLRGGSFSLFNSVHCSVIHGNDCQEMRRKIPPLKNAHEARK